jgi:hypothetical protein
MSAIRLKNVEKAKKKNDKQLRAELTKAVANGDTKAVKELEAAMASDAPTSEVTAAAEQLEDDLVTYREFMSALKSLKDTLYKNLLPQTMAFSDVLASTPVEMQIEISDTHLDDFMMFRYELNTIFNKH